MHSPPAVLQGGVTSFGAGRRPALTKCSLLFCGWADCRLFPQTHQSSSIAGLPTTRVPAPHCCGLEDGQQEHQPAGSKRAAQHLFCVSMT